MNIFRLSWGKGDGREWYCSCSCGRDESHFLKYSGGVRVAEKKITEWIFLKIALRFSFGLRQKIRIVLADWSK